MNDRRSLVAFLVVALAMASLGGCGSVRYAAKPNEELYGTWQNEDMGESRS